ncbi:ATP-binding protein [Actinorugispora endophytica]|uniref:AAA+ ATPase domain-containing protein n=1 Tax=Actinorugispora endophytica TaxID=1605990 RepID=A0A4R6V3W4_9ACTN|nr:ATP-binding protein [Actinorugispora endophytica]TDQ53305.1 hypothetical protein EV190_10494 [Actinorugispora endophytica]
MREPVRYCDAIRLLGADDARVVGLVDRLTGDEGTDLLDARTHLVGFAHRVLNRLDREAHLLSRVERTRRIAAAHSVIVVTAFFEALDDTELPFRLGGGLDETAASGVADHKRLGGFVALLVVSAPPLPRPQRATADGRARVRRFYLRRCKQLPSVLRDMPLWEELDEAHRDAIADRLGSALADRCVRRYEELRDKLAASFPEFGAWASLHTARPRHATLPETPIGLTRLQHRLQSISTGRVPSAVRGALARSHQERLNAPVPSQAGGTHVPPLAVSYVNPCFRAAEVTPAALPHDESWWHGHSAPRDDLAEFLIGHVTSPRALTHPLVVLGPAGSGKSTLTALLAARLPESDFTAVRVSCRDLPEDAGPHALADRLDHALAAAGGGNCDALPVLVLDGLEELTTCSSASRSGLLEGMARFQRERAAGPDPVAVVLTCRDSTAARVRFPADSVAVRLEDFTDAQLATWLDLWNRVNASHFHHNGVLPLDRGVLDPHLPLARRPLPLLLLAVYDGVGNALRRLSAPLRETALYERWLRMLADIADRADPAATGRPVAAVSDPAVRSGRIELALLTASLMAVSLFNRPGRGVGEETVAADRAELVRWPSNYARPLDPLRLGCVTRDAGGPPGGPPGVAFTDPVLGDYLVARLVAEELAELAEARVRELRSVRPAPLDDSFLYALLSFTPLSVSGEVPRFLSERLRLLAPGVRDELRLALAELLRDAGRHRREAHYGGYRPAEPGDAARDAVYTANLMLALVAVHGGGVPLRALFGRDAPVRWRSLAHLWKSQLPPEQWTGLTHALEVRWEGGALVVHPDGGAPLEADPGTQTDLGPVARDAALLADTGTQRLLHALEPLTRLFGGDVTARPPGGVSGAGALLTLAFGSAETGDEELVACYGQAFAMADGLASDDRLRFTVFLLRQLRGHVHRLGARLVPVATRHVRPIGVARSARASVRRLADEHNDHVEAIRGVLAGRW